MGKRFRVGVLGTFRGAVLANIFAAHEDVEIVAGCDSNEEHLYGLFAVRFPRARLFIDYDDLLAEDPDIVIVASACPDHGPHSVRALEAGKHVLTETTAFHTPAEGVALVEAVEKAGRRYMFGENYCFLRDVLEMQRICQAGELGEFIYGQCEYVHDTRFLFVRNPDGSYHWRCWYPPFYYGHALGPLLYVIGARPISVIGQGDASKNANCPNPMDFAAYIVRVENGGLIRVLMSFSAIREPSSVWYSLYATKGQAETDRWRHNYLADLHVYRENEPDVEYARAYRPRFAEGHQQAAWISHAGADWYMVLYFLEALRKDKPMPIDVYQASDFTLPGMLAYRSHAEGGRPVSVPDFRDPAVREQYKDNHHRCPREEVVRSDQVGSKGYETYFSKIKHGRVLASIAHFSPEGAVSREHTLTD